MLPPTVVLLQVLEIFDHPEGQVVLLLQDLAPVVLLRQVIAAKASVTNNNPPNADANPNSMSLFIYAPYFVSARVQQPRAG